MIEFDKLLKPANDPTFFSDAFADWAFAFSINSPSPPMAIAAVEDKGPGDTIFILKPRDLPNSTAK